MMSFVEIISHSFPNSVAPFDATFVSDHAVALAADFDVHIMVPTPYALPFTNRHKRIIRI
ncbi:MAG: hypothetical protein U5K71_16660 [Gracilimonas sp.]|nr:hypothetical protein [Gracilimonas sp.]